MQQALKDPDDQPDHWIQAADKLAQLLQLDANFMDAAAKWQTTQRWLALPDLYNRLQDAFERDDWTNVLALWQHIASVKPKYRFTQDLFARAWPEIVRAGVTRRVSQPDGKEMLLVPAGEFTMGSNAYEVEKPIHTVYLDTFYLDRYPVTNAEYKKFVDATRRAAPQHWQGGRIPSGFENHPVVVVSWNDAVAYAQWAGKRLPTEAEWEKAASWDFIRGVKRAYPWGDTFDASKCNSQESGIGTTTPVGKYSPHGDSPYGVGDMAGNVWEWVADWYDDKYYASSPRNNPTGPSSGQYRVVRGGAWGNDGFSVRAANRLRYSPTITLINVGFRCARSP